MSSIEERIQEKANSYPKTKEVVYVYSAGECIWQGPSTEKIPYKYKDFLYERVEDTESNQKAINQYYRELDELYKEAYNNLEEYMGWEDIDAGIVEWISSYCWERAHSSGYSAIIDCATDFDALIDNIRLSRMGGLTE